MADIDAAAASRGGGLSAGGQLQQRKVCSTCNVRNVFQFRRADGTYADRKHGMCRTCYDEERHQSKAAATYADAAIAAVANSPTPPPLVADSIAGAVRLVAAMYNTLFRDKQILTHRTPPQATTSPQTFCWGRWRRRMLRPCNRLH